MKSSRWQWLAGFRRCSRRPPGARRAGAANHPPSSRYRHAGQAGGDAAVFYYIYSSTWLGEVADTYRVFFETMQGFFTAYILFTLRSP